MRFAIRHFAAVSFAAILTVRYFGSTLPGSRRASRRDWRFAGFRGSASGTPQDSEEADAERWGGGELGAGIYVCTDKSAAWLYGAAQAQHASKSGVTLWAVDFDAKADWIEPTPVPTSKQYERFPTSLSKPPHDVLINAAECKVTSPSLTLPSQYKINAHRTGDLRLRKLQELDVDSAFNTADEKVELNELAAAALPAIPVAADGQCFYSAVAFHVKLSPREKADTWRQFRRGLSFWRHPFGQVAEERRLAHEVRKDIAAWLRREVLLPNGSLGPEGPRFLGAWNLLNPQPTSDTVQKTIAAIGNVAQSLPASYGDPQLLWPAIHALYGRQIVVHVQSQGAKPWMISFGTKDATYEKLPIELIFSQDRSHCSACYWRGPFRSE